MKFMVNTYHRGEFKYSDVYDTYAEALQHMERVANSNRSLTCDIQLIRGEVLWEPTTFYF